MSSRAQQWTNCRLERTTTGALLNLVFGPLRLAVVGAHNGARGPAAVGAVPRERFHCLAARKPPRRKVHVGVQAGALLGRAAGGTHLPTGDGGGGIELRAYFEEYCSRTGASFEMGAPPPSELLPPQLQPFRHMYREFAVGEEAAVEGVGDGGLVHAHPDKNHLPVGLKGEKGEGKQSVSKKKLRGEI